MSGHGGGGGSGRKMTPKGQMSRGANSGPAIMMMPPHIRATFVPNPPLKHIPPIRNKRKQVWTGMSQYLDFVKRETSSDKSTIKQEEGGTGGDNKAGKTIQEIKKERKEQKKKNYEDSIKPQVEQYRKEQRKCGGEYNGMNCYNTLFVGRLAYEVTERKLLREMETFGPIKDIKIIVGGGNNNGKDESKSKGYAFIEYEHEEDMKRAYRAADGMKIEGKEIVVDVERGHTVPTWLPRRLGGGLGGTRLGGKELNVTAPGRFDPSRPGAGRGPTGGPIPPPGGGGGGPPPPMGGRSGGGGPPPPGYGGGGGYGGDRGGGPPPGSYYDGYRDGPPPPYGRGGDMMRGGPPPPRGGGGGGDWDRGGGGYGGGGGPPRGERNKRRRSRSRSPPGRHRRRY